MTMHRDQTPGTDVPAVRTRAPHMPLFGVKFKRAVRGYDSQSVDRVFARARDAYETVWREKLRLELEAEELRAKLEPLKEEQKLSGDGLVVANRLVAEAEAEAAQVLAEAREQAIEMIREATACAEQTVAEARVQAAAIMADAEAVADERAKALMEGEAGLRAEVARLEEVTREMRSGYRAFLLAALELLEAEPAANDDPMPARTGRLH
jgi:cell division septum initiation protein DivIVA